MQIITFATIARYNIIIKFDTIFLTLIVQKNVSNSNIKKYDLSTKEKNQKIAKFFQSASSAGDNNIRKKKF